ncbi:hypothetical protein BDZ89DRAFT_417060 [Hymenopellis radicata]|nr:hypothetical protein BDZ89DRAFT_417060 [Hymenopellis radicata]
MTPTSPTSFSTSPYRTRCLVCVGLITAHFVCIVDSPRLNCLLSFFPHMCRLRTLTLQHIQFHKLADSAQFLHALEGSPIEKLALENCTFSISAFSAFFKAFGEPGGLRDLDIDGICLFPDSTQSDMEDTFDVLLEGTQDWDQESTWELWDIEKPVSSSFLCVDNLNWTIW